MTRTSLASPQRSLLMLILLVMLPASRSLAQFNFTINSAAQVSYMNPFLRPLSSDFELNFTYFNPPPGTPKFLNAYIRVPFTTTQRWVIQNLLLDTFASPRPLTYTMKLGPLGYVDGMPTNLLDISYFITDTVQKDSINVPPTSYQPLICGTAIWNYGGGLNIDSILTALNLTPPNDFHKNDTLRSVTRGCNMPNIDLDSSVNNPGTVPGYAGDWNACVPTSCANSMEWLEARHPTTINSGLSLRDKLKELSSLMKRQNNTGVMTDTMIKGKLAYIDKYQLPIHVKFQDLFIKDTCVKSFDTTYGHCAKNQSKDLDTANKPKLDFNWLFDEMKKGEDVEMLVQWVIDSAGTVISRAGHAVVLSGVSEVHGVTRITIKDDSTQEGAGGTRERPLTFDTTGTARFPVLKEWGWVSGVKKATCYVTGWVSESYDSTVTFVPVDVKNPSKPYYGLVVAGNPLYGGEESSISFRLSGETQVHLAVFDLMGRQVNILAGGSYKAGKHTIRWKGTAASGASLPAGLYFITLTTPQGSESVKLLKE